MAKVVASACPCEQSLRWLRRSVAYLFLFAGTAQASCLRFVNGLWFNDVAFARTTFYSYDGRLTHQPCSQPETVDLHSGYVVPPYGDAHEHNFDNASRAVAQGAKYLRDGIFYAQGMTDITSGSVAVRSSHLVNTPTTVDVTYAHGALTGINGHPKEVYESIPLGFYYPATSEQREQVIHGTKRLGEAYWEVESPADLDIVWPKLMMSRPDLIKIILTESEAWRPHSADDPQLGKGINPALVPLITAKAHSSGLKVAAHVDTPADFETAVRGGVDEIGHLPGYGADATTPPGKYRLSDASIRVAAERRVRVQATASQAVYPSLKTEDLAARKAIEAENLLRLKQAGVPVLVGSDRYGDDSVLEMDFLQSLGVWTNLELLRMAAVTTPQTVFPKRKLGLLRPGYEASFLVLAGDPLQDWKQTHKIIDRWKQGEHIVLPPDANGKQ